MPVPVTGTITEVASLIGTVLKIFFDPKARKESYKLYLDRRARKAMDMAEQYILTNKEYMALPAGDKKEEGYKKLLSKYEKLFFRLN